MSHTCPRCDYDRFSATVVRGGCVSVDNVMVELECDRCGKVMELEGAQVKIRKDEREV